MDISAYQHMNIRMSTRGKRPLRNLTPSDKVRAIQRIHNGETKASVSRDIGVPESTLRGWCKNEQKLRFMCRQLGASELPISMLENPPEKRTKYDVHHMIPQKIPTISGFDEFTGYGRLSFNGMDFVTNSNNNGHGGSNSATNGLLEKIALTEFMKKNSLSGDVSRPVTSQAEDAGSLASMSTSVSAGGVLDYSQLSMMQEHLNLLSLLNPNFMMISGLGAPGASGSKEGSGSGNGSGNDNDKAKNSIRTSNAADTSQDSVKSGTALLSVKNWAKDPSDNTKRNSVESDSKSQVEGSSINSNDTNNNAVQTQKLSQPQLSPIVPDLNTFLAALPPGVAPDSENNNTALLEWCKVFNASLNFLALTAAAAALQAPQSPSAAFTPSSISGTGEPKRSAENILYKQLTKTGNSVEPNDASNDSYYESEPEDLSLRSPTSKISSTANSRSQSPAKSIVSNASTPSDADQ